MTMTILLQHNRVTCYRTGADLGDRASKRLVDESEAAGPTGAVGAYQDADRVWQYAAEGDPRRTHTVFVDLPGNRMTTYNVDDRVLVVHMNDEGVVTRANPERDAYVVKGNLGVHYVGSSHLRAVQAGEIVFVKAGKKS